MERSFGRASSKPRMKRYLPMVAGILLGLCFLAASIPVLFNLFKMPPMPEGTPAAQFMAAFVPTGYMKFVKVFELLGAVLVMIPRLRNFGLLVLGPIIINIIAYNVFVGEPKQLVNPMMIVIVVTALYLLWHARQKFAALGNESNAAKEEAGFAAKYEK